MGTLSARIGYWIGGQDAANLDSLEAKAVSALTANATYLALAAPTTTQNTAQTRLLTRQVNALIRIQLLTITDISDT